MKLKTLMYIFLSLIFFLIAGSWALAYDFEENFDSYPDAYNIGNEPEWTNNGIWEVEGASPVLTVSPPNSLWSGIGAGQSANLILMPGGQVSWGSMEIQNRGEDPFEVKYYNTSQNPSAYSFKITEGVFPERACIISSYGSKCINTEAGYNFYTFEWEASSDKTQIRLRWNNSAWTEWLTIDYGLPDKVEFDDDKNGYLNHNFIDNIYFNFSTPSFSITSPQTGEAVVKDSWITVEGVCPTDGINQIAFTNDCSSFSNLDYTVDCVNGTFSDEFYYNGISDWVVAVDQNSIAGDCVDYDDLMDGVQVYGIELIEGYPDDWHFNFNYYDDYDIKINYPVFNTALTLPRGTATSTLSFNFVYPSPLAPNLIFKILQYDNNGNLLDGNYHSINLIDVPNTSDYQVGITASSTASIHYVVQLFKDIDLVRQYPFMVAVSDLDIIVNPDDFRYLFPRLVEKLKTKVIFNYYFAFHDGFYNMFNASSTAVSDDALDITFKSVSDDGEYNLDVKIFSASDERVKSFAGGLRPYITAILWLVFASYVIFRVTHLFSDNQ